MTIKKKIQSIMMKTFPTRAYVAICYKHYSGKKYDFNNIKLFTEKRWWLKYYYKKYFKELIQQCYDKYTVREYVEEKIGKEHLVELYGVYDSVEEIDFESLPNKFVLKITQSNGYNIICSDKSKFDAECAKEQLSIWLTESRNRNYTPESRYYYNGKAKIICEKYLEDENGKIPNDLKIFCFNGEPMFTYVTFDAVNKDNLMTHDYVINLYDKSWNYIPVQYGRHPTDPTINFKEPKNYSNMLEIAKVLSKEFVFVRVDLYNIDGKIYFGELTWVPSSDDLKFTPDKYDEIFGKMLTLPDRKVF